MLSKGRPKNFQAGMERFDPTQRNRCVRAYSKEPVRRVNCLGNDEQQRALIFMRFLRWLRLVFKRKKEGKKKQLPQ